MRYLLDTNTCIRYLNGTSEEVRRHIETTYPYEMVVCSVVKAELFYGAENSQRPQENLEKQHFCNILSPCRLMINQRRFMDVFALC